MADADYAASTTQRRLAAIGAIHKCRRPPTPEHPGVTRTLAGINRTLRDRTETKRALNATAVTTIARAATEAGGLAGARDTALVLLGFAGGLRRSELTAVERADLINRHGGLQQLRPGTAG